MNNTDSTKNEALDKFEALLEERKFSRHLSLMSSGSYRSSPVGSYRSSPVGSYRSSPVSQIRRVGGAIKRRLKRGLFALKIVISK